ncbi:immune inhibitor A [Nocardioides koreensis]|uniref:Immune inhibitor A n=1 Tax=Nocardioides koreensis TaxID=433651 RepID=A0ABN2Z4Y3_9ACTN
MRRTKLVALATASLLSAAGTLSLTSAQAGAAPAGTTFTNPGAPALGKVVSDVRTPKWRAKYEARNQAALEKQLRTGARGDSVKLGKGKYGRVGTAQTDKIFVVLAEFGNTQHSAFAGQAPDAQRVDGPMRNEIPEPDRTTDNSTLWQSNYDRAHYENMYFNRMKSFYEKQSSGHYSIDGDVTEWVKVPFNEARYGRDLCASVACNNTWFLVRDALAVWTKDQLDSGKSMEEIQAYLKTFDHQDRYDFDGDGDFNEPDGYIDHFQIVHAGGDAADGDPIYGSDAIWSHRWNAQIEPFGTGPEGGAPIGGVNVGEGGLSDPNGAKVDIPNNPTGVWVNDYTIQPENGGLSVFAHEFGHDLGLPDLYDTSGNTGGASNTVEHWSLMSQSRGTAKKDEGIGDQPMSFGAWEKLALGWLNYKLVKPGETVETKVHPNSSSSLGKKSVIALLPDKQVPLDLGAPCDACGSKYFYSDMGDSLDNTMTRTVAGGGALTAKVRYEIEDGYDYAFLQASNDGGQTWANVPTSESYDGSDEAGTNSDGTGISGTTGGAWVDLTATVPDGTNALRWRYLTDGGYALSGFQVDNITLGGTDIGNAETDTEGWTLDGFRTTTGSEIQSFLNAYILDNRQFVGQDKLLNHLYNFRNTHSLTMSNWVDFYHNEPGALISYWDTSYTDNNVGDHPGHGQILPVDAHPQLAHLGDQLLRTKLQTLDSTFGLHRTDKQTVHLNGEVVKLPSRKAVSLFDDTKTWWHLRDMHGASDHPGPYKPGWIGVDVPKTGTTIKVLKISRTGVMTVKVHAAK